MTRLLLGIALICVSCGNGDRGTDAESAEFSIFLTRRDVSPAQMLAMSQMEPADEPILGTQDITAYIRDTHELVLAEEGRDKLDSLHVPVSGRSFLVCVGGSPVYNGAFWTLISSASFDGPVIVVPAMSDTVRIEIGYPGMVEGREYDDPRGSQTVMEALAAAVKLQ